MNRIAVRILVTFAFSWLLGIACLFIALQFSPPRWSMTAMKGALFAAAESSLIYVLPPLLILTLLATGRKKLSALVAISVACIWIILTVAWWAFAFSPFPWAAAVRNVVILLPGALIPSLIFYFMYGK
jgi:hypothetical protein